MGWEGISLRHLVLRKHGSMGLWDTDMSRDFKGTIAD